MLPEPKGCSASAIGKKGALRVVEPSALFMAGPFCFLRCNSAQADVHQPEPRRKETRVFGATSDSRSRHGLGTASASQSQSQSQAASTAAAEWKITASTSGASPAFGAAEGGRPMAPPSSIEFFGDSFHLHISALSRRWRPCNSASDALCEPYDWLMNGEGKAHRSCDLSIRSTVSTVSWYLRPSTSSMWGHPDAERANLEMLCSRGS